MTIPVIFINFGNQDYFAKVVAQAGKRNDVFVLGDGPARTHDLRREHEEEFASLYEHLSTNGRAIELFCFTRWFHLQAFMAEQDVPVCLYLDSDVLLYSSATQEYEKFRQFDFTLVHRTSGHTSFWTRRGIDGFCAFLLATYRDKNGYDFDKIASHFHVRQKHGLTGGVCDMTLLEYYAYKVWGRVGEMMHIVGGSTYDHNINVPDQGYAMRDGHKDVHFDADLPWCMLDTDKVFFNTLHCQGPAKRLISDYARG